MPKRTLECGAGTPTGLKKRANVTKKFNPDATTSDLNRHRSIDGYHGETKDKVGGGTSDHSKGRKGLEDFGYQSKSHELSSNHPDIGSAYRICFIASLDCARFLLMQGMAFSGPGQSPTSINKGNLLELIDLYKKRDKEVERAFDMNVVGNIDITSPLIQKGLAKACAQEVTEVIIGEIGDGNFTILIDDSHDMAEKYQMAVFVRFVNKKGKVIERFLGLEYLTEDTPAAFKETLVGLLAQHGLSISKLRGQGYDGASNMRCEFNDMQLLIHNENPYAFYVHCFAHQLESVLITVSRCSSSLIHDFFVSISLIITTTIESCQMMDKSTEKHHQTTLNKLESGEILSEGSNHKEKNLASLGGTRWGSYYTTLGRINMMWDSVLDVLMIVHQHGRQPSRAGGLIQTMESFEFVFILKMMLKLFTITNELSLVLQRKDEGIIQAVGQLTDVKECLQTLRNNGWESLFEDVKSFCATNWIPVPNMDEHIRATGHSRRDGVTLT